MVRLRTSHLLPIDAPLKRLAVLIALLSLPCGAYLYGTSIRARYLSRGIGALQLSHSSFEDAQRLARRLDAKPYGSCDKSYCFWTADVSNARLPRWWRALGVTFAVDFEVKDSLVVYKGAWYAVGLDPHNFSPSTVSVGEKEQWIQTRRGDRTIVEPPTGAGWEVAYFEKDGFRSVATARFAVRLTPRSSAKDWQRYTAFNYSCLWKYKGCKNGRELLPTADPFPSDR